MVGDGARLGAASGLYSEAEEDEVRAEWAGASLRMRGRLCIKTMKQMLRSSTWGGRFVGRPAINAWLLTWRPKYGGEGGNETGIKDNALINGGRRCVLYKPDTR